MNNMKVTRKKMFATYFLLQELDQLSNTVVPMKIYIPCHSEFSPELLYVTINTHTHTQNKNKRPRLKKSPKKYRIAKDFSKPKISSDYFGL